MNAQGYKDTAKYKQLEELHQLLHLELDIRNTTKERE